MIATRAVHIGACLVLLSLFAFETLIATPAFHRENSGTLCCARTHGSAGAFVAPTLLASLAWLGAQTAFYDHVIKRSSCACIKCACVGTTRTLKP